MRVVNTLFAKNENAIIAFAKKDGRGKKHNKFVCLECLNPKLDQVACEQQEANVNGKDVNGNPQQRCNHIPVITHQHENIAHQKGTYWWEIEHMWAVAVRAGASVLFNGRIKIRKLAPPNVLAPGAVLPALADA